MATNKKKGGSDSIPPPPQRNLWDLLPEDSFFSSKPSISIGGDKDKIVAASNSTLNSATTDEPNGSTPVASSNQPSNNTAIDTPPSADERLSSGSEPPTSGGGSGDDNDGDDTTAPAPDDGPFQPRNGGPMAAVMDDNFLQFASYAICDRAIPTIEDGFKPVQRRIMHTLSEMDDGRFIKVATVVGKTMAYHPHGDASIYSALVNLANKRYLIEGQGNFGNIFTGDGAAAGRYIECRLTDLARDEIFNPKTTTYIPSYDGRNKEPVLLPSKLPLLLMLGANGIAVGMATLILPHNFIELIEAEIAILRDPKAKPVLYPDFMTGGIIDCSEYNDGNGRIRARAKFEVRGPQQLVITELPFGQTTETLIDSIEKAARAKKVPVKSIHDSTSDHAEIIITLIAGADAQKAIKQLYAATNCESAVTANLTVLENNRPVQTTVSHVLRSNVDRLVALNKLELEIREGELLDEQHRKTLIQIFVEERIYKRIEKCTTSEQVRSEIYTGFKPFADKLVRPLSDDDVEMLLAVPIRRISLFDINKNHEDIENILKELGDVRKNLGQIKSYTIAYLKGLIKKYRYHDVEVEITPESSVVKETKTKKVKKSAEIEAPKKKAKRKFKTITVERFPRLTQVEKLETIDVKAVTATSLELCYDKENGFIGTAVAIKSGETILKCSSLDKLVLLWNDGRYKLVNSPSEKEKIFVDKDLREIFVYNRDKVYTLVYTETEVPFSCLKRFAFGGMIQNKEYNLLPEPGTIRFFEEGTPEFLWIKFRAGKGMRILQKKCKTEDEVAIKGVHARGKQLTTKPIAAIAGSSSAPRFWDEALPTEKGLLL